VTSSQQVCTTKDEPSPGATAGLKPGDKIVSIDGAAITSWAQETKIIRASAGKTLTFVVQRASNTLSLSVTPRLTPRPVLDATGTEVKNPDGSLKMANVGFVGIGPGLVTVQQPITSVLPSVGQNIAGVAGIIVNLPAKLVGVVNSLFTAAPRDPTGPISVVGVGRIAGEIASIKSISLQDRAANLIGVIASLNVALLVFNLIPLMPLDGGHVAVALWEALRRGFAWVFNRRTPAPPDTARLVPLTFAVVVILVGMSALLIVADFIKPVTIN
jgi:membrane-associated protease RseP (regulator of RpoE activity)